MNVKWSNKAAPELCEASSAVLFLPAGPPSSPASSSFSPDKAEEGGETVFQPRYISLPRAQIAAQTFQLDAVLSFSSSPEDGSREEGSQEAGLAQNKQKHNIENELGFNLFLSTWKYCTFYKEPASSDTKAWYLRAN